MVEFTPKLLIWLWPICTFIAILGCLYALIAAGLLVAICPKMRQRAIVLTGRLGSQASL